MKAPFIAFLGIAALGLGAVLLLLTHGSTFPVLSPSGYIGTAERDVMLRVVFLMLIVVIPVVILAIFIGWHYREGNAEAAYTPNWEHSKMEEFIWWSIPFEIVLVLGSLTWTASHELDPMRALASTAPPVTIEVVALPWKWLFIYPAEGIASVNELALPAGRPVEFHITADAPMNSFWIPALGGQMYAMTGMTTVLHLMADHPGDFVGRSANYSGEGFAQMQFSVHALDEAGYEEWVAHAKQSPDMLTAGSYSELRAPGDAGPVHYYGMIHMTIDDILNSYMPSRSMHMHLEDSSSSTREAMPGMDMSGN